MLKRQNKNPKNNHHPQMSRSVPARKSVDDHFNWPCNMTWNHETLHNGDWNDGPSVTIVIVNQECFTSKAIKRSCPGCPAKGPWCTCGWRSMFSGRCPSAGKLENWKAGKLESWQTPGWISTSSYCRIPHLLFWEKHIGGHLDKKTCAKSFWKVL